MGHPDRPDPLAGQNGSLGPMQRQGAGDALQLDMFWVSPHGDCGPGAERLRAERMEILGEGPAPTAPPHDDAAQLRLAFLREELARVDAG